MLDYTPLIQSLQEKYRTESPDHVVECPSPVRNSKPIILPAIGGYNTVHGKWATRYYECDIKRFPDFCTGYAYVTTPKLALQIAEMAANLRPLNMAIHLEDVFITGMLRERIEGVVLELTEN